MTLQVRVRVHFLAHRAFWTVSGQDNGILWQSEYLTADTLQFLLVVTSWQVGTSYAHAEEGVTG